MFILVRQNQKIRGMVLPEMDFSTLMEAWQPFSFKKMANQRVQSSIRPISECPPSDVSTNDDPFLDPVPDPVPNPIPGCMIALPKPVPGPNTPVNLFLSISLPLTEMKLLAGIEETPQAAATKSFKRIIFMRSVEESISPSIVFHFLTLVMTTVLFQMGPANANTAIVGYESQCSPRSTSQKKASTALQNVQQSLTRYFLSQTGAYTSPYYTSANLILVPPTSPTRIVLFVHQPVVITKRMMKI